MGFIFTLSSSARTHWSASHFSLKCFCSSYRILEYNTYRISVPFRVRLVILSKDLLIHNKWRVRSRSFPYKCTLYICILDCIHQRKFYFSLFKTKEIWGSLFLTRWLTNTGFTLPPESHMIISVHTEKAFDEIQHPLLTNCSVT